MTRYAADCPTLAPIENVALHADHNGWSTAMIREGGIRKMSLEQLTERNVIDAARPKPQSQYVPSKFHPFVKARRKGFGGVAALLLLWVEKFGSRHGRVRYPGHTRIKQLMGCSRQTIYNALRWLESERLMRLENGDMVLIRDGQLTEEEVLEYAGFAGSAP